MKGKEIADGEREERNCREGDVGVRENKKRRGKKHKRLTKGWYDRQE